MMPRAAAELFTHIGRDAGHMYTVTMSYVQIYMEMLQVGCDPHSVRKMPPSTAVLFTCPPLFANVRLAAARYSHRASLELHVQPARSVCGKFREALSSAWGSALLCVSASTCVIPVRWHKSGRAGSRVRSSS